MGLGSLIVGLIAGAKAAAGTAGLLAAFAIDSALALGANALARRKADRFGKSRQGRTSNIRAASIPHQVVVGQCRKGGLIFYLNGTGEDNKFLHMAVVVAAHEIASFDDYYFNGELTELDGSGIPTGNLRNNVRIQEALGTATQSALTDMVSENANWTTAHQAIGRAYFYARLAYGQGKKWPSFIPAITVRLHGANQIHDPRDDSTAWTDNPALVAAWILEQYVHIPREAIDQAALAEAADICDETVDARVGTVTRYRCGGFFELEGQPEEWLAPVVAAMAGSIHEYGGTYYIRAGAWRPPLLEIGLDDIVGGVKFSTAESDLTRPNAVKGTFVGPDDSFDQPVEFPVLDLSGTDPPQFLELDLEFVPDHRQAQRIAKMQLAMARLDGRVELDMTAHKGLDCQPDDTIRLAAPELGLTGTWRVEEHRLVIDGGARASLILRRHDATVYDWDASVDEQTFSPSQTNLPGSYDQTRITSSGATRITSSGAERITSS